MKLTTLSFDPHELNCMPIMFTSLVCALLSFCTHVFPDKSKT